MSPSRLYELNKVVSVITGVMFFFYKELNGKFLLQTVGDTVPSPWTLLLYPSTLFPTSETLLHLLRLSSIWGFGYWMVWKYNTSVVVWVKSFWWVKIYSLNLTTLLTWIIRGDSGQYIVLNTFELSLHVPLVPNMGFNSLLFATIVSKYHNLIQVILIVL